MSDTTDDRPAAIRARCDRATAGPWEAWPHNRGRRPEHSHGISSEDDRTKCDVADVIAFQGDPDESAANAHFIAHAREDLPWLLARVAALAGEVERVQAELRRLEWGGWAASFRCPACPACGGVAPGAILLPHWKTPGHEPDCTLAAALARLAPPAGAATPATPEKGADDR